MSHPLNNQLEVFVVGNDGRVYVLWKHDNSAWQGPAPISEVLAPPGAGITSTLYPLNNQLEVFLVGNDGRVDLLWKHNNSAWQGPAPLSVPGFAASGTHITSVYYPVNHQLEVFVTGNDGQVHVIWKHNNGAWSEPAPIPSEGIAQASRLNSSYYPLNNQLEVFATGNDGHLYVLWKHNNGPWQQPGIIGG
jgi:hypothetical protein